MSRANILLWHWGRRGGGPRFTLELARALAKRDDVRIHLSLSRQSELYEETKALGLPGLDVDTYCSASSALRGVFRLPAIIHQFGQYLRDNRIQLIDCTMAHLWNLPVLWGGRRHAIPYILTLHDATPHPGEGYAVRGAMIKAEASRADQLIVLSNHVGKQAMGLGVPAERIEMIPHGIFTWAESQPRTYPRGRPFRLLFFGRIQPYKGLHLLLQAFPLLRQRHPDIELHIAGPGDLEPYRSALQQPGLKVDNRWIPEDEVAPILAEADAMIMPYLEASQSGVAASAYGAGLPMVATPIGGIAEQVLDGMTGVLARDLSPESIADAAAKLIGEPVFYENCSRHVQEVAKDSLSWTAIAARTARVYTEVLNRPSTGNIRT